MKCTDILRKEMSWCNSVKDNKMHTTTVGKFLQALNGENVRNKTFDARKHVVGGVKDDVYDAIKRGLPCGCFSATFDNDLRRDVNAKPTGICLIEVDHVGDETANTIKDLFISHESCFYSALSLSACGCYALFIYNAKLDYKKVFTTLCDEFDAILESYNCSTDRQCNNIGRLRVVSYDSTPLLKTSDDVVVYELTNDDDALEEPISIFDAQSYDLPTANFFGTWKRERKTFRHLNYNERLRLYSTVCTLFCDNPAMIDSEWNDLMMLMDGGKHTTDSYIAKQYKYKLTYNRPARELMDLVGYKFVAYNEITSLKF